MVDRKALNCSKTRFPEYTAFCDKNTEYSSTSLTRRQVSCVLISLETLDFPATFDLVDVLSTLLALSAIDASVGTSKRRLKNVFPDFCSGSRSSRSLAANSSSFPSSSSI
jgi:hypothetical protein